MNLSVIFWLCRQMDDSTRQPGQGAYWSGDRFLENSNLTIVAEFLKTRQPSD